MLTDVLTVLGAFIKWSWRIDDQGLFLSIFRMQLLPHATLQPLVKKIDSLLDSALPSCLPDASSAVHRIKFWKEVLEEEVGFVMLRPDRVDSTFDQSKPTESS